VKVYTYDSRFYSLFRQLHCVNTGWRQSLYSSQFSDLHARHEWLHTCQIPSSQLDGELNIRMLDRPDRLHFIMQSQEKVYEEVIEPAMKGHTEVTSYSSRRRMVPTHSTMSYNSTEKAQTLQSWFSVRRIPKWNDKISEAGAFLTRDGYWTSPPPSFLEVFNKEISVTCHTEVLPISLRQGIFFSAVHYLLQFKVYWKHTYLQ
jgi:hypothetical protein